MKPQDFLIGIRDLFSIVVPGVLLLFFVRGDLPPAIQPDIPGFNIFVFATAAYLVGAIASGVGAVLDSLIDGILGSRTFRKYRFSRSLVDREALARKLHQHLLKDCPAPFHDPAIVQEPTKVFWRNHLRLHSPAAIVELDRLEAMQKMYRTLVPVFAFLMLYAVGRVIAGVPLALLFDNVVGWFLLTLTSFVYYAGSRWRYLDVLYALAIAFCVQKCTPADADPGSTEHRRQRRLYRTSTTHRA